MFFVFEVMNGNPLLIYNSTGTLNADVLQLRCHKEKFRELQRV